jgi:hypothetical protein
MENAISSAIIVLLIALYVNYLANRAIKKLDRKFERRIDTLSGTSCEDDFAPRLRTDYERWMDEYYKGKNDD